MMKKGMAQVISLRVGRLRLGSKGFTLIEVMIAVVIVGLLAAIAYPAYTRQIQQSRQTDAQGQIMEFASALEGHRSKNFSYAGATLPALGPELAANSFYNVAFNIGGTNQTYTITATPRGTMSGTATLTYDSAGGASWD